MTERRTVERWESTSRGASGIELETQISIQDGVLVLRLICAKCRRLTQVSQHGSSFVLSAIEQHDCVMAPGYGD